MASTQYHPALKAIIEIVTESTHLQPIGLVVIGRNEGERLRTCLQSVLSAGRAVVYVDSGSADDSVLLLLARSLGAVVRRCTTINSPVDHQELHTTASHETVVQNLSALIPLTTI